MEQRGQQQEQERLAALGEPVQEWLQVVSQGQESQLSAATMGQERKQVCLLRVVASVQRVWAQLQSE